MKNGSNGNGLVGTSCVTRTSAFSSKALPAPRISFSGSGAGLTPAPRSTRKSCMEGLRFVSTIERSSGFRNLEIGLGQQKRQLQSVFVINEPVFRVS